MKTDPLTNVCLMAYLLYLGKKCIIRLSCALGFTVLLMLAAFIALILPFSIQGKPDNVKIIVHENTKAAVKDFPVFYVSKVTIFQSLVSSQSLHKMKFYLAENGCDRLPKNTRYSKPNESRSRSPNYADAPLILFPWKKKWIHVVGVAHAVTEVGYPLLYCC